jgi:hypothetical protein
MTNVCPLARLRGISDKSQKELSVGERPLLEQIILDEIDGKNKAIHAYDQMLWTIRSGFLTLVFVGWGFMLKGMIDQKDPDLLIKAAARVAIALLLISLGLAFGGFIIDINYVRRKFRVINALNNLFLLILERDCADVGTSINVAQIKSLSALVHVSGDTGDISYRIKGYCSELVICFTLYFVPILMILAALQILGVLKKS